MKIKRFTFKTFIAVIVTILIFIGIHTYNFLQIQSTKFTDEWGRGIEIGKTEVNIKPIMGTVGDKILTITFNKAGSINYLLTSADGQVLEQNSPDLNGFNINKVKKVLMIDNNLFYLRDGQLYQSVFEDGKGFIEPQIVDQGLTGFSVNVIDGKKAVQTFHQDEIVFYDLDHNTLTVEKTMKNEWNLKNMMIRNMGNQDYIFLVQELEGQIDQVLGGPFEGTEIGEVKLIKNVQPTSSEYLGEVLIEPTANKFALVYSVTHYNQGTRTIFYNVNIVNEEMTVELEKSLTDTDIGGLDQMSSSISLYKKGDYAGLVSSAINRRNKYAVNANAFVADITPNGKITNITFLSNTEALTKNCALIESSGGDYLAWVDKSGTEYNLMLNSTNSDFKTHNKSYTQSDYKKAMLKSLASPFYALAFMFVKGFMIFVYTVFAFMPTEFILRKLRVESEKLRFVIFTGIYILINLLTFGTTHYSGNTLSLMPEVLKFSFAPFVMPLVINIVSALIVYVFYREMRKRDIGFIGYVVFFVGVDIYLSNLLFTPFAMINIL